jgi:hypothetical protein
VLEHPTQACRKVLGSLFAAERVVQKTQDLLHCAGIRENSDFSQHMRGAQQVLSQITENCSSLEGSHLPGVAKRNHFTGLLEKKGLGGILG